MDTGQDDDTSDGDASAEQGLLSTIRCDLDDVDAALTKLEQGAYGRCEACGAPISDEVLSSSPAERFCAAHRAPRPGAKT